jgi:hypothetical protein
VAGNLVATTTIAVREPFVLGRKREREIDWLSDEKNPGRCLRIDPDFDTSRDAKFPVLVPFEGRRCPRRKVVEIAQIPFSDGYSL